MKKNILMFPDAADGGSMDVTPGQPSVAASPQAPMIQEQTMPESLKGVEVDLSDIEAELPKEKPTGEEHNKDGQADAPIVKEKTGERQQQAKPATQQKPAQQQQKPTIEKGKLSALPQTQQQQKPAEQAKPAAQQQQQQQQQQQVDPNQRDYSLFTAEEQKIAKASNNQQFNLMRDAKLALKDSQEKFTQLNTKLEQLQKNGYPSEWYNSPQAFVLSPEFQNLSGQMNRVSFETEHYRQQLIAIENNEEFCVIKGYDNKTGQPIFSDMQKPSAEAKVQMQQWMQAGQRMTQDLQGKMGAIQQNFSTNHQNLVKVVDNIIEQKWPWAKDEKDPRQERVKEFDAATPVEFHGHPSHKVARLMWATIFDLATQLDDARAQAAVGKTVQQIQNEVEPTVSSVASAESSGAVPGGGKNKKFGGVTEFKVDDDVFKD